MTKAQRQNIIYSRHNQAENHGRHRLTIMRRDKEGDFQISEAAEHILSTLSRTVLD